MLTGVAVMTSRPKSPRRLSSTIAPGTETAAATGLEARKPMMPPAARMPSAPSGGLGMPSAMCERPQAAKVSAMVPTTMRLVDAVVLRCAQQAKAEGEQHEGHGIRDAAEGAGEDGVHDLRRRPR